jgi:hypothetical protein
MHKIILFFLFLLTFVNQSFAQQGTFFNPMSGDLDGCVWIEEIDGSPANRTCGKTKVSNGALTDNGDGTYTLTTGVGGGGDVSGPSVSTDNAIIRFDGAGGKTIQDSSVYLDDSGVFTSDTGLFSFDDDDVKTTGAGTFSDFTLESGIITNSTGTISFDDEDLVTSGSATFGDLTTSKFNSPYSSVYVIAKSGGDYTTVQSALTAHAEERALFIVQPGTYTNDTINFSANYQTVMAHGKGNNVIITNSSQILEAGDYEGVKVKNIRMNFTPTTAINGVEVNDGTLSFDSCRMDLTTSSAIAGASQPALLAVTGTGTLTTKFGEYTYQHTGNTSTGVKAMLNVATGGTIKLLRPCTSSITNSGTAAATTIGIDSGTGTIELENLCNFTITDTAATIVAGIGYIGGSGDNSIKDSKITVVGGGANTCYGIYNGGTGSFRSNNNVYSITGGALNYSFFTGASAVTTSHFDEITAVDGDSTSGKLSITSSETNGNFTASGVITSGGLLTTDSVTIDSDSARLYLGDGQDSSIYFDGASTRIEDAPVKFSDTVYFNAMTSGTDASMVIGNASNFGLAYLPTGVVWMMDPTNVRTDDTFSLRANVEGTGNTTNEIFRVQESLAGVHDYPIMGLGTKSRGVLAQFHQSLESADASTAFTQHLITRATSGTPEVGIGTSTTYEIETAPDVYNSMGRITVKALDITPGDEYAEMALKIMVAGLEPVEVLRLNVGGLLTTGSVSIDSDTNRLRLGADQDASIYFDGSQGWLIDDDNAITFDQISAAAAGGDNLGNHTATKDLAMAGHDITNMGTFVATDGTVTIGANTVDFNDTTDNYVLTWDAALSKWSGEAAAGGGAPVDATYLVNSANGTLSDEIVIGSSQLTMDSLIVTGQGTFQAGFNMNDDTSGNLIISDGTTFRAVAMSSDATIDSSGAVTVANDSHAHTGSTLSGIDISDDTNLAGGTNITLSGDTLNVDDAFIVNNASDTMTGMLTTTGGLTTTGSATFNADDIGTVYGASQDASIYFDSTENDMIFKSESTSFQFHGNGYSAIIFGKGGPEIYYDGTDLWICEDRPTDCKDYSDL